MNLQAIASGVTSAILPKVPLCILISAGSQPNSDGTRTPVYCAPIVRPGNVQPIQYTDIQQLDGLNIQGTRRAIFINGRVDGLVRVQNKGGDLIITPDGKVWLVAVIAEQWPEWCRALVTLQDQVRAT